MGAIFILYFYPTLWHVWLSVFKSKLKTDNLCCTRIGPGYIKECDHSYSYSASDVPDQENHEEPIAAIACDWNQKNRPHGLILIIDE